MKILVIGNGFDLAHGLPTSYKDFLEFCARTQRIYTYQPSILVGQYERDNLKKWAINDYVKDRLKNAFDSRVVQSEDTATTEDVVLNEIFDCINGNAWINYFRKCPSYVGENWIDFETEISKVIRCLDEARKMIENEENVRDIKDEKGIILKSIVKAANTTIYAVLNSAWSIEEFSKHLYGELEKMIRALEMYISEFVQNIPIELKSKDVENLNPSHIVSFNYSNTYERLYGVGKITEYDYIHGKADINNTIQTNNMVLGIDEYLPEELQDKETEFIAFKKYYQRIYKMNKRLTETWCSEIKKEAEYERSSRGFLIEKQLEFDMMCKRGEEGYNWQSYEMLRHDFEAEYDAQHPKHELYIFGHSLDVTDKDILRELLLNDNVNTTIFYYKRKNEFGNYDNGRKDYGEKIKNLVKVIGPEGLRRRTSGGNKTIEFRLQEDMVE